MKHTPAPWIIRPDDFNQDRWEITSMKRIEDSIVEIAVVNTGWSEPFNSEMVANAQLIAAAPEMLEVLQKIIEANEDTLDIYNEYAFDEFEKVIEEVKSVIAKATGNKNATTI